MSEQELEKEMAKLKAIEQRKASVVLGRPELDSVEDLLTSFEPVGEALLSHVGYNTLREFLVRIQSETNKKLTQFEMATDIQTKKHEENTDLLRDIHGQLEKMIQMLTLEVAARQKQRDLEFSTLQQLNRYMDNWL